MAKFNVYLQDSGKKKLGSFNNIDEAVMCGVNEVRRSHSSECEMAKEALRQRGFYCMGWSSREVYIEEE